METSGDGGGASGGGGGVVVVVVATRWLFRACGSVEWRGLLCGGSGGFPEAALRMFLPAILADSADGWASARVDGSHLTGVSSAFGNSATLQFNQLKNQTRHSNYANYHNY